MKKIFLGLLLFISCLSIFLFKPPKVNAYSENIRKSLSYNLDSNIQSSDFLFIVDSNGDYAEVNFSYNIIINSYFDSNEVFTIDFIELDYIVSFADGVDSIINNDTITLGSSYTTNYDFDSIMLNTNNYSDFTSNYLLNLYTYIGFVSGEDYITINIVLSNFDDTFYFEVASDLVVPLINEGNVNDFILVNFDGYLENNQPSISNAFTDFAYQVYVDNTSYRPEPLDPNVDMWTWLGETIGGFMDFEIFPSFSIGAIFNIVISIALFLIFLKVFVGG